MTSILAILAVLLGYAADPEHNGAPTAVDTALVWLGGIRDNHPRMLGMFMTFPFSYREVWAAKRCTQIIVNTEAVPDWLTCTHEKESRFIDVLRSARNDPGRLHLALGLARAGKRLRAQAQQGSGKSSFINGSIKGDGVTYEFVFAVSGSDAKGRRASAMYIDSSADK